MPMIALLLAGVLALPLPGTHVEERTSQAVYVGAILVGLGELLAVGCMDGKFRRSYALIPLVGPLAGMASRPGFDSGIACGAALLTELGGAAALAIGLVLPSRVLVDDRTGQVVGPELGIGWRF